MTSHIHRLRTAAALGLGLATTTSIAGPPTPFTFPPWAETAAWQEIGLKEQAAAKKNPEAYSHIKNGIEKQEAANKAENAKNAAPSAMPDGGKLKDLGKAAYGYYDELSKSDKAYAPDKTPPGSPSVPSKCMENENCRPCFEKAHAGLAKTRINLEKVKARYSYTHRFTKLGQEVITAAGAAGGTIAGLGASAENLKIDKSLEGFDEVVRAKNQELLGKLQDNLKEVSACEAEFYKNDDWYNRYGFTYYQFMLSVYSY